MELRQLLHLINSAGLHHFENEEFYDLLKDFTSTSSKKEDDNPKFFTLLSCSNCLFFLTCQENKEEPCQLYDSSKLYLCKKI